ncbi:Frizzled-9 [Balamuthia mandrillaris]
MPRGTEHHWVLWILLGVALLVNASRAADTCAQWSGFPVVCQQFGLKPGQYLFVPEWINGGAGDERLINGMEDLEAIVIDRTNSAQFLAPKLGVCADDGMKMVCTSWLRPCVMVEDKPVVFPQQTCHDTCTGFLDKCTELATEAGVPPGVGLMKPRGITWDLWSCDMPDDGAHNTTFYQTASYSFAAPLLEDPERVVNVSTQCNPADKLEGRAGATCNSPLEANEKGVCVFECPLPSLSDSQYDALEVMQSVLGWLSWVGSMFLCLSYIGHPKLRSFPANLIMMTALSAHIASLAFILPNFVGTEEVWCDGGTEFVPNFTVNQLNTGGRQDPSKAVTIDVDADSLLVKGPWCQVQGLVLQFGFLAGTFWWAIVVFNIFIEVNFPDSKLAAYKTKIVVYHCLAWGFPAIFTIIPLAADRIAFPNAGSFCFISYEDNYAYQLACWFIPVGLLLLAGSTFFLGSLFKLIPLFFRTPDRTKRAKLVRVYFRLMLFVAVQLGVYLFIFIYTIVTESNKDEISEGYEDYYSCLLFVNYPDYPRDSCSLSSSVTYYPLIVLRALGFSILGFLLFLNFVTSTTLSYWGLTLRALVPSSGAPLTQWPMDVWTNLKELWETGGSSVATGGSSGSRNRKSPKNTSMVMTISSQEDTTVAAVGDDEL